MKRKIIAVILSVTAVLSVLSGCGSSYDNSSSYTTASTSYDIIEDLEYEYYEEESIAEETESSDGAFSVSSLSKTTDLSEKLIYSAYAEIETLDFDSTIELLEEMLEDYDAFLESSSVSGINYSTIINGYTGYRDATYTIRVPAESFTAMKDGLSVLGNVIYCETYTENITTQYTDTSARLEAYEAEYEQLIELLEQCETVEDIITVRSQLTEVQYEIDSLTSTLRNWQNEIDYSTLTLYIDEVRVLTDTSEEEGYWQQIAEGFMNTLANIGSFFKWLFKTVISLSPAILLIAIVIAVVIVLIRFLRRRGKRKKKKTLPQENGTEGTESGASACEDSGKENGAESPEKPEDEE